MKAVVTLTSSESKRLIAKGVVQMPEVMRAFEHAYLLLSDGTTNAFIAQELLNDQSVQPGACTIGLSIDGILCVNTPKNRKGHPNVFYKGVPKNGISFAEALADYHEDTVVLKGANAIDPDGMVGIITTGFDGGTIPRVIGPVSSKGLPLIVPVGLEKLVFSVPAAARAFNGSRNIDISFGATGGMFCLPNAQTFTEIDAARILFQVEGTLVCAGGIGGNEGAVTLVFEGEEQNIRLFTSFLEHEVKGEPPITGQKGVCATCRYASCRYHGLQEEELPGWMKYNK